MVEIAGNNLGQPEFTYTIDTELSPGNLRLLPVYLRRYYLLKLKRYRTFRNIRAISENGEDYLAYRVLVPKNGSVRRRQGQAPHTDRGVDEAN